jgi:hypothetical protein
MKHIITRFLILSCSLFSLTACLSDEQSADGIAKTWSHVYENGEGTIKQLHEGVITLCSQMEVDDLERFSRGVKLVHNTVLRVHLFEGIADNTLINPLFVIPANKEFSAVVEAYVEKSKSDGDKHKFLNPTFFDKRLISMSAIEYLILNEGELLFSDKQRCQALINITDEFKQNYSVYIKKQEHAIYPWLLGYIREDKEDEMMDEVFSRLDYLFAFAQQNIHAMKVGDLSLSSNAYQEFAFMDASIALETINATYGQGKFYRYLNEMKKSELDATIIKEFENLFVALINHAEYSALNKEEKQQMLDDYLQRIDVLRQQFSQQVAPTVKEYLTAQR